MYWKFNKSGSFWWTRTNKKNIYGILWKYYWYNKQWQKGFDGQVSMFDLGGETQKEEIKYNYIIEPEYDEKEKLSMEKEMLGIYISGHPLEKWEHKSKQKLL